MDPPLGQPGLLGGRHRSGSAADLAGCEAAAEAWELSSLAGLQAGVHPGSDRERVRLGAMVGNMVGNRVGNRVETWWNIAENINGAY